MCYLRQITTELVCLIINRSLDCCIHGLFTLIMSCRILIDSISNLPGSSQGSNSNHNTKRHINQSSTNILTFLSNAIFLRRLRLLKIYMATIVILILLFVLLKPSGTQPDDLGGSTHDDINTAANLLAPEDLPKLKYKVDLANQELSQQHHNEISITPSASVESIADGFRKSTDSPSSPVSKMQSHTTNFTYTLTASDFAQMKNVNLMQVRIKEATKHSWDNYRRYAWGHDMLKPRAKEPDHWFNLGLTIVDAVDTLVIMGMTHDMNQAFDWIENDLKFNSDNENSNCFEMTIRILAGLLSAYHLSGREKIKHQAIGFGDILLHCYDTKSKIIPYSDIDLSTQRAHPPQWNPHSSLSEVASLQLEFRFLSQISGDTKYEETTFLTSMHLHNLTERREHKLLPMYINPHTGELEDSIITLGARSDSYYEYLLKQYLQTGIKWLEEDYLNTMDEVRTRLIKHTDGEQNYTYVAELQTFRTANETEEDRYYHKMDHLVCFLPGTLALGYYHFSPQAAEYRLKYNLETPRDKLNSRFDNHLELAMALSRTCWHMYSNMGTGLSPEIASFVHSPTNDPLVQNQPELQVQSTSAHNILRPEFVESLFYLYHITGLSMYRNQASHIFEAFQKYSRIPSGYSAISDVRHKPEPDADLDETLHRYAPDRMESFWLSETLKYLYLTFCDDKHIVGTLLNNYVFNTEAHMFPIN